MFDGITRAYSTLTPTFCLTGMPLQRTHPRLFFIHFILQKLVLTRKFTAIKTVFYLARGVTIGPHHTKMYLDDLQGFLESNTQQFSGSWWGHNTRGQKTET